MRFSYRSLMEMIRFLLVFITCSLLCYGIVTFLSDRFLPANPYREPRGNAVKVVTLLQSHHSENLDWYVERLQLFYLTGE